jgi:hypothetical protein
LHSLISSYQRNTSFIALNLVVRICPAFITL